MMVFGNVGGRRLHGKQVLPIDYQAEVSQRLVDASHAGDLKTALECIADPFVDVNFVGTVCLKSKKTEVVLHDESATEVRVEFEEFKTEVTALFLAAHTGNASLVRKLLSVGVNVNQKLFRGYATTAAVREAHIEILVMLVSAGAAQAACEEALQEAVRLGQAIPCEVLMGSNMIRPHVCAHALVSASCRGFVDVADTLIKCGVKINAKARVLLQSAKPSLHANVDCNALVAAVVSRHASVVQLLLQNDCARIDTKVGVGAWSWDNTTGEEFRVGAGLAEPYSVCWCAVEYFETSGAILEMLLQHLSPNIPHLGRTLIHHAILCRNARAVEVLLNCGADMEFLVKTTNRSEFRPLHMAARLRLPEILQTLINAGCNINSKTDSGETAVMICSRYQHTECLKVLALAGADFGLINMAGHCAQSIARSSRWSRGFQQVVLEVIRAGKAVQSSNAKIFSPLVFVARANDLEALKILTEQPNVDLDEQDENGFSAIMIATASGNIEAFRLLVNTGANLNIQNKFGDTAISLSERTQNNDAFEKVMLEYSLAKGTHNSGHYYALLCAAGLGDLDSVRILASRSCDVNVINSDGYTPLMLAAKGGHTNICELLISCGAMVDVKNATGETALLLARKNGLGNAAEQVIFDEIARRLVLDGSCVKKHTRRGKGAPHRKVLKMVETTGVLKWGSSTKRNVACRSAEVGPSSAFCRNRRKKYDVNEPDYSG